MYTSHDFDDVIEPAQHISKCQTNINIPNSNSPSATSIQPNQSTQLMQTRIQPITLAKLLQQQSMMSVALLSLGSNHKAEMYLAYARDAFAKLGQICCSLAFENPDFTATAQQPKPDYTNQCVLLTLLTPMSTATFITKMAQIEKDCLRQRDLSPKSATPSEVERSTHATISTNVPIESITVPIDSITSSAKTSPAKQVTLDIDILAIQPVQQDVWYRLIERYQFKAHEIVGIQALNLELLL